MSASANALAKVAPVEPDLTMSKYDAMVHAIEICTRCDEAKKYHDTAAALEEYYRQAHNTESERLCVLIRLRAARRCGKLLRAMKETGERAGQGVAGGGRAKSQNGTLPLPELKDLGITKKQSHEWQRLASVPWEQIKSIVWANLRQAHVSVGTVLGQIKEQQGTDLNKIAINQTCFECHHNWTGPAQRDCPSCGSRGINLDKYPRMIALYYDGKQRREFGELEQTLRRRFGTTNTSMTILEALRKAAAAE
jgi:hypothetical protein